MRGRNRISEGNFPVLVCGGLSWQILSPAAYFDLGGHPGEPRYTRYQDQSKRKHGKLGTHVVYGEILLSYIGGLPT
jgi:hypothetical protein